VNFYAVNPAAILLAEMLSCFLAGKGTPLRFFAGIKMDFSYIINAWKPAPLNSPVLSLIKGCANYPVRLSF
jgi:hypothetical protein